MLRRSGDGDTGGLVCVVTTVKDTRENLDRFVERNLAGGADHLFMYVDDADESTYQHLARHRHVTAVRTGAGYWQGARPRSLNRRQWVNANLTNVLLAAFPEVAWLFHLDGDEELDLDRERLLALGPEVAAVRLETREAVASPAASSARSAAAGAFKRQLEPGELALLTTLGVIPRPSNTAYFHGHTTGKSGLRPSLDLRLGVHTVETLDRAEVAPLREPWLRVLHHDSVTPEEFLRKWSEHLRADNTARFRNQKEQLRAALATLQGLDVDDTVRHDVLLEIYRRHVADDVDLLDRLGFLVTPEAAWHRHRPRRLGRAEAKDLEELLDALRHLDKQVFLDKRTYAPREVVAELVANATSGSLQNRLKAVERACRPVPSWR